MAKFVVFRLHLFDQAIPPMMDGSATLSCSASPDVQRGLRANQDKLG
jgi:hypothetical protein